MSPPATGTESKPPAQFFQRAADLALAGLVLAAGNELAHWRLGVRGVVLLLAAWGVVLAVAEARRLRWPRGAGGLELLGLAVSLIAINYLALPHPVTPPALAWLWLAVAGSVGGWRRWQARSDAVKAEPLAEPARVLCLLAGAGAAVLPFFTDHWVGGTDARWYGYMVRDFLEQWRAGGPPVFIGQGEFAWNGGVHPFRTAPVLLHVAGGWDWLTCGALEATALKHLALITSALLGTLAMFAAGVSLAPRRRWEAAAVALLYVWSPGWLLLGMVAEAYMTFMTLAALPLVLYGNARLLLSRGASGGVPLAAGLALVWMSHPPAALITTLVTLCLQSAMLTSGPADWAPWRSALRAGLLFLALSAYYFTGMMELPRAPGSPAGRELLQFAGATLVMSGAAGVLLSRRHWLWGLAAVPGFALLWRTSVPWFDWMAATVVLLGAGVGLLRRLRWFDPADYAPLVMLACMAIAAAATGAWLGSGHPLASDHLLDTLHGNAPLTPGIFLPLSPDATVTSDFQPGPGLWLAGVAGLLTAFRARAIAAQCFAAAAFLLVCFLVSVPGVSEFLVGYFPVNFAVTSGLLMFLRNLPVLCALLAMGGLLWLQANPVEPSLWRRRIILAVLLVLVAWAGHDALKIARRGWWATASGGRTQQQFRTENAVLDRFVYDLLPHPATFSHGKMDPRLEIRFAGLDGRLLAGPDTLAREMEAGPGTRRLSLTARVNPHSAQWLKIEPGFTLQPGEHLLLRFEFDPNRRYDGYLFVRSEQGYREYLLPQSGLDRSFGTGPEHSRVLSLWNSGSTPEHYELSMKREEGNDIEENNGAFADLSLSRYDPSRASLRVESLRPWRVAVRVETDGWLTTPRVFLPGYTVTVDGEAAEVRASTDGSLQVRLTRGRHTVEARFHGSRAVWLAGAVSAVAWLGLLVWAWRRQLRGSETAVAAG